MLWFILGFACGACGGVLYGVYACKRAYEIPKGVTPEQHLDWIDELEMKVEMAAVEENVYGDLLEY